MNILNTASEYARFITAREFWNNEGKFVYEKTLTEKFGNALIPTYRISDIALRRIQEPRVIVTSTIVALGIATLSFYPEKSVETILSILPIASIITPWAVKFTMFLIAEMHIIGFGMRTYGRFDNPSLLKAWQNKSINAIPIGAIRR